MIESWDGCYRAGIQRNQWWKQQRGKDRPIASSRYVISAGFLTAIWDKNKSLVVCSRIHWTMPTSSRNQRSHLQCLCCSVTSAIYDNFCLQLPVVAWLKHVALHLISLLDAHKEAWCCSSDILHMAKERSFFIFFNISTMIELAFGCFENS